MRGGKEGDGRTGLYCPRLFRRPLALGGRTRGSRLVRGFLGGLRGGRRFGIFAAVAVSVAAVEVAVASVVVG